jgi:hypothetical protein
MESGGITAGVDGVHGGGEPVDYQVDILEVEGRIIGK